MFIKKNSLLRVSILIAVFSCVIAICSAMAFADSVVVDSGAVYLNGSYDSLEVNGGEVYAMPGSSFDNIVVNGGALYMDGAVVCSEWSSALTVSGGRVVATNTDFTVKQYSAMHGDTSSNPLPVIDIDVQEPADDPNVIFDGFEYF